MWHEAATQMGFEFGFGDLQFDIEDCDCVDDKSEVDYYLGSGHSVGERGRENKRDKKKCGCGGHQHHVLCKFENCKYANLKICKYENCKY